MRRYLKKKPSQKGEGAGGVAQGIVPDVKPQNYKKKKKEEEILQMT
jgi:hypothetical protein